MKTIDHRKTYYIVLDCETAPLDNTLDKVMPSNMFAYDIGWAVVDKKGNVYESRSYVVADIYSQEKDLMRSAYYANKLPQYEADMEAGDRIMTTLYNVRATLKSDCEVYGVKEIYAHNMRFDYGSLNNTYRWVTKSKYRYFFPYGIEICDTLKMARQIMKDKPTYRKFCQEHGYITKNHQLRYTAEVLYKFISGDWDFEEAHTGLEDVLIEKEILSYLIRQHKPMERRLWA